MGTDKTVFERYQNAFLSYKILKGDIKYYMFYFMIQKFIQSFLNEMFSCFSPFNFIQLFRNRTNITFDAAHYEDKANYYVSLQS